MLTMSSDPKVVGHGFETWRRALIETGVRDGLLWRLPEQRIVFRNQADNRSESLGERTALGTDPTGGYWAVQINEADTPGNANVTTGIAVNEQGAPFLIRQGRLNSPIAGNPHILEVDFRRLTNLEPTPVLNGDTSGKKREWHIVTRLDVDAEDIRDATGRFVDRCALARLRDAEVDGDLPDTAPVEGLGRDEQAEGYTVGPRIAVDAKEVRRLQGEVWQQLALLLRSAGILIDKPRHAAGYEVDAVIAAPAGALLVEIKTGNSAADVYGGMGQLQLYPRLLPRLGDHRLVLLLPGLPQPALVRAIDECGVLLHTYRRQSPDAYAKVEFDDAFLGLCGLD
ncbi:hypothetical protein ASE73_04625 [Sphingomonas sp. Leaf24]|uniref:hypothetical protein n=2 Tax=Sphingomonas TaxID=13687 RepID=UPI0006F62C7A|nr:MULTISPECIES: hypothetical protein [unclassified Sphingomonas]KQM90815.1 hypothetical protein ASE73_04625 [Sphingomonas sp. Leaf24]KQM94082.1 hypothetical protein ASE70_11860 [Sphingomonas sp. Leaf22]